MKTIKEAAMEHSKGSLVRFSDFITGVNFAQEWILVDDELPENTIPVIVKNKFGGFHIAKYESSFEDFIDSSGDAVLGITHWRKIELK